MYRGPASWMKMLRADTEPNSLQLDRLTKGDAFEFFFE